MKDTPVLKTQRLTLRPFTLEDVDDVYEWCSSFAVTRFLFWHPHRDKDVTQRLVASWVRKKRNYSWALDAGNEVIGEVQVIKDLPDQGFEIGYSLKEKVWHQGYMTEAVHAVLTYLFSDAGYLYSSEVTDENNLASRKLLEAMGYQFVELKKDIYIAKIDRTICEAVYRLDKEAFLASARKG